MNKMTSKSSNKQVKKVIGPEKKVCALHDISCAGRCSLTVVLPVLSVAGIECNVIPTAILSTHTGEFTGYTFRDLTDDIPLIADHWQSLGRTYDAVYSGFFGSAQQLKAAADIPEKLRKRDKDGRNTTLVMVDPVMADAGKLYTGFDMLFVDGMREYCKTADIIVPNMTEACLLLGKNYDEGPHDLNEVKKMTQELSELGPSITVITGVKGGNGNYGAAYFDREKNTFGTDLKIMIPGRYYGTGDLFASALLAGLLKNLSLERACDVALDLVHSSIERTYKTGADVRYGVDFETFLGRFAKDLNRRI